MSTKNTSSNLKDDIDTTDTIDVRDIHTLSSVENTTTMTDDSIAPGVRHGGLLLDYGGSDEQSSTRLQPEKVESMTTECPICMEDFGDLEAGALGKCGSLNENIGTSTTIRKVLLCGHVFCHNCLYEYCYLSTSSARVPIPCPVTKCSSILDVSTVQGVMLPSEPVVYEKFLRLQQLRFDQTIVECPFCCELLHPTLSVNDIDCKTCQKQFCRIHGASHAGISCADFRQTPQARQLADTERVLLQFTQKCSHCCSTLQKISGCDHIVCPSCHNDMCWKCGTHIHLTGKLVRHCANCEHDYRDHRYDHIYRWRLCLCLPLMLPFYILYTVIATVLGLMSGCFFGCFHCGRCFDIPKDTSKGYSDINDHPANIERGIAATVFVIFLPFIKLFEDFGIHLRLVEKLFPETENEIPLMEISTYNDKKVTQQETE